MPALSLHILDTLRVPRAFRDIFGKRNLPGKIDKMISK